MKTKTASVIAGGLVLRLVLFGMFPFLPTGLDGSVECSTPVSSFKRLQEGLYQHLHGASPYHGSVFHQSPLLLALFESLGIVAPGKSPINVLYSVVDAFVAYHLSAIATTTSKTSHQGSTVAAIYLFNPFTLLSTLSRSTGIFSNATIVMSISAAITGKSVMAMNALALSSCLSVYPVFLLPGVMAVVAQNSTSGATVRYCTKQVVTFLGFVAFYTLLSYYLVGSWEFVYSTYGTILLLTDLTPTIGIWWYFFTEMFDYFRPFFVGVFQIFTGAYSIPLALRFRNCPLFAVAAAWGIVTMFRSYPEVGDIGFYFTLLTLYKPIFGVLKYPLPSSLVILYVSVLAPTFYHLWIYAGSGNANFFYAITLVYTLGMTLITSDSIWAAIRYEYDGGKNPNLSQI